MIARMWEARTAPGGEDAVVRWLQGVAIPAARAAGCVGAEAFRAPERAVLITRWPHGASWTEPPVPPEVLRAHAWSFQVVPG